MYTKSEYCNPSRFILACLTVWSVCAVLADPGLFSLRSGDLLDFTLQGQLIGSIDLQQNAGCYSLASMANGSYFYALCIDDLVGDQYLVSAVATDVVARVKLQVPSDGTVLLSAVTEGNDSDHVFAIMRTYSGRGFQPPYSLAVASVHTSSGAVTQLIDSWGSFTAYGCVAKLVYHANTRTIALLNPAAPIRGLFVFQLGDASAPQQIYAPAAVSAISGLMLDSTAAVLRLPVWVSEVSWGMLTYDLLSRQWGTVITNQHVVLPIEFSPVCRQGLTADYQRMLMVACSQLPWSVLPELCVLQTYSVTGELLEQSKPLNGTAFDDVVAV